MKYSDIKRRGWENADRQKSFFADGGPGLLAYVSRAGKPVENPDPDNPWCQEGLKGHLNRAVITEDGRLLPDAKKIEAAVEAYLREYREEAIDAMAQRRSDAIPCVYAHWDIGWHTAAMAGMPPRFSGGSWWLEPNMDWESIESLRFDPDSPWLVTALYTHQALWKFWEEDYWIMPFVHRSPLDYANGLRGTELFYEMIENPDRVKKLLDWCVSWQLEAEAFLYGGVDLPSGWGTGIMGTWGPDRAVWVNGDPVGLISREMMLEFEQPYTGRLFTSTGGGFFHNHTLGLYQVDRVCSTPGIHMQNFTRDPNRPTVAETMISDPASCERIVEASLQTPILFDVMTPETLHSVLPIVSNGRFILGVSCGEDDDLDEVLLAIRKSV